MVTANDLVAVGFLLVALGAWVFLVGLLCSASFLWPPSLKGPFER